MCRLVGRDPEPATKLEVNLIRAQACLTCRDQAFVLDAVVLHTVPVASLDQQLQPWAIKSQQSNLKGGIRMVAMHLDGPMRYFRFSRPQFSRRGQQNVAHIGSRDTFQSSTPLEEIYSAVHSCSRLNVAVDSSSESNHESAGNIVQSVRCGRQGNTRRIRIHVDHMQF